MNKPKHIAIIMDGNGRWAQKSGLPRVAGHRQGAEVVRTIINCCIAREIPYLTLYAFSQENWKRPKPEISFLMNLLDFFLRKEVGQLKKKQVRLRAIGRIEDLPSAPLNTLKSAIEATKDNTKLNLNLALNYSSRAEILDACRSVARCYADGKMTSDVLQGLDEQQFSKYLWTHEIPDPDLLIRTSGELRLSNFLLWQLSYSEIYISEKCWPEFSSEDFDDAIAVYSGRQRRYGDIVSQ